METNMIFIKDEETAMHIPNLVRKLNTKNAEKSILTFKCLNTKKIKPKKQSKLVNI